MAYDEGLAERIRSVLDDERSVTEKKMFGGIAFLRDGKMFVGIIGDKLMVRVGPERYDALMKQRHVRPMDFSGKTMRGFVYVTPEGVDDDDALAGWVRLGSDFVATLPAKKPKRPAAKPKRPAAKPKPPAAKPKPPAAKPKRAAAKPAKRRRP